MSVNDALGAMFDDNPVAAEKTAQQTSKTANATILKQKKKRKRKKKKDCGTPKKRLVTTMQLNIATMAVNDRKKTFFPPPSSK